MQQPKAAARKRFKNPPVVEVVAGIQFADLNAVEFFSSIESLWITLGKDFYVSREIKQPLSKLDEDGQNRLRFVQSNDDFMPPRMWFLSKEKEFLVQVQADRLIFNWRKLSDAEDGCYSNYETKVWAHFDKAITQLDKYVQTKLGQKLLIEAMELSYYNAIPFDDFGGPKNIHACIKGMNWTALDNPALEPDTVHFLWGVPFNRFSNLQIQGLTGRNLVSGDPILRFDISSKGAVPEPFEYKDSQFRSWFDESHTQITSSFAALTTDEMHKKWGIMK